MLMTEIIDRPGSIQCVEEKRLAERKGRKGKRDERDEIRYLLYYSRSVSPRRDVMERLSQIICPECGAQRGWRPEGADWAG